MNIRRLLCAAAISGILGYGGCTDAGTPTDPSGLNLGGAWTGSITYYDSPPCTAAEGIAVTLLQAGRTVTGSFQTSCVGILELRGAIDGNSITGQLYAGTDGLRVVGRVDGTTSPTSIRITTWGTQPRRDDGPRVRPVINRIDLTRS
jgi:hypothetical protein